MRVFVSVGTDHHPFGRLVQWADRWSADHPHDDVTVQHGSTRRPAHARGVRVFSRAEMEAALKTADVVVISCGPGGVMDTRHAGIMPIVVPRRRELGEHVDDHQLAFARHLSEMHLARSVESFDEFVAAIEEARTVPDLFRVEVDGSVAEGIATVGRHIDQLVWTARAAGPTER